jgi:hypothetical protein
MNSRGEMMARARRRHLSQFVDDVPPPRVKTMPAVCPMCQEAYPDELMLPHLQSHAPASLCSRCDEKEKGWRLDLDGVQYFRKDVSLFYCSGCGRYPAVDASPAS